MLKRIHFFTGKGGTGKSAVAAGFALARARAGVKTLLVEIGNESFYREWWPDANLAYKPHPVDKNLSVAHWSGLNALRAYAVHLIKIEKLVNIFFENAVTRSLIEIAPGLLELAILGQITSGPRKHGPIFDFDEIVVDAFATGHFLSLLRAPRGMSQAIRLGPMGEQSRGIDQVITDPRWTDIYVVATPEEMPVQEAGELRAQLQKEFGLSSRLILNKWIDTPPTAKGSDHPFAQFLQNKERQQNEALKDSGGDSIPLRVPMILSDDTAVLRAAIADAFLEGAAVGRAP